MLYVENECVFSAQGRSFEAGGAIVTPEYIVAYPAAGGVLNDWHGRPLGTWQFVATWRTPRSFMSSTMSQIKAVVDGVTYTGRGAGIGMIYRGRKAVRS